jgi:hypothetical protein
MTKNATTDLFEKYVKVTIDKNKEDDDKSSSRKGVERMLSDLSSSLLSKGPRHNNRYRPIASTELPCMTFTVGTCQSHMAHASTSAEG